MGVALWNAFPVKGREFLHEEAIVERGDAIGSGGQGVLGTGNGGTILGSGGLFGHNLLSFSVWVVQWERVTMCRRGACTSSRCACLALGASPPERHFRFVHGVAVVGVGDEAGGLSDGAVDVLDIAAGSAHHVVVVVSYP